MYQNDAKAVPHYVSLLKDPDQQVKRHAAYALAKTPDPSAVDDLARLLKDKDQETSFFAAIALGQLGDNRGADEIISLLTPNPDEEIEREYVYNLETSIIKAAGKIKDKRAVAPIIGLLGGDVKMSVFDGGTEEEIDLSRNVKIDALKLITSQDFGYAFYRWMAWSVAQGNTPESLFPGGEQAEPETVETTDFAD